MVRGTVWWAELREPTCSEPGFPRPVIIVSADSFNRSRIRTVLAVALSSNLKLGDAPGNVVVPASESGLPKDSVANVSQVLTIDKSFLSAKCRRVPARTLRSIDSGLKLALSL